MANRKRPKMVSISKIYDSSEGVWRTIGGRRVFIKIGQSLSDAMKDSGKFKTKMNEEAVKGAREEDLKEQYKDSLNNVSKMEYNGEITKEEYDKAVKNINKAYIGKRNDTLNDVYSYTDKQIDENKNPLFSREDKFYTRKDGTKEYDPYKGTRFEKKYDSVDEAIKDPNSALNKYINEKEQSKYQPTEIEYMAQDGKMHKMNSYDYPAERDEYHKFLQDKYGTYKEEEINENWKKLREEFYGSRSKKVPRASGAKDFSEYGIRIEDENVKSRFSDYLRDKYGTDDFRIISYDDSKKAQNIYSEFNKQELKAYQDRILNSDEYLAKNNPGMYLNKLEKEAGVRTFADDIALMDRYKGTYEHLQKTTNMSGAEILELLKRIDEDKK